MCKFNPKNDSRRIDPCMENLIIVLNDLISMAKIPTKILACCCGHRKYPMTIICRGVNRNFDLLSDITIHRKKRFYKKDKGGFYYIPETLNIKNGNN